MVSRRGREDGDGHADEAGEGALCSHQRVLGRRAWRCIKVLVDGESEGTLLIPGGLTGEAAGPITVTATVASTSIARVVSAVATCE